MSVNLQEAVSSKRHHVNIIVIDLATTCNMFGICVCLYIHNIYNILYIYILMLIFFIHKSFYHITLEGRFLPIQNRNINAGLVDHPVLARFGDFGSGSGDTGRTVAEKNKEVTLPETDIPSGKLT